MDYKGKKVFVSGASGFIGSHLVEALVMAGADVTALVRYNGRGEVGNLSKLSEDVLNDMKIVFGDITDSGMMQRSMDDQQIVFHLAALIGIPYSYIAPESYLTTNVKGTMNLLEAARLSGIDRFIQTSTSETYGTATYTPIDEAHPLQGQSPYSASKIASDKFAESYCCAFELPVITVRPFNTYGPRQSQRAVIPTIASQLLNQCESLSLGNLSPVRDMTYVSDTVQGFLAAGMADSSVNGEVVNLGTGTGYSVKRIAELLMDITGHHVEIDQERKRVRPETSEVYELVANAEKAKKKLAWQARVSLKNGLHQVVNYLKENPITNVATDYVL